MGASSRVLAACVLAALVAAAGCTRLANSHGYVPADSELSLLRVGADTRSTVASIVGQPATDSLRTANAWYYVKSDYETFAWRAPVEVSREVVAITYDDAGRVANIERFGLEDGRVVALSRRVTERNVQGITFLRQLFGNIGNFRIGDLIDG